MKDKIRGYVTERELLEQLAEEAAELAQAALKKIRTMDGVNNPTTITAEQAEENLLEEIADVLLVVGVLGVFDNEESKKMIEQNAIFKNLRWLERLEKAQGGENE